MLGFTIHTGRVRDPFFEFKQSYGKKLASLNGSGELMTVLELYLQDFGLNLSEFADRDLSDFLMGARKGYVLAFGEDGATRLRQAIVALKLDETKLTAFLAQSDEAWDALTASQVLDAAATLQIWLSQVDREHIGLLEVG